MGDQFDVTLYGATLYDIYTSDFAGTIVQAQTGNLTFSDFNSAFMGTSSFSLNTFETLNRFLVRPDPADSVDYLPYLSQNGTATFTLRPPSVPAVPQPASLPRALLGLGALVGLRRPRA